ncbi:MAG: hypothetical protein JO151_08000 [Verrucomicrobia bacterium]|nr:hypothetical protein [Verrucomicrobiota bacterium]
MKLSASLAALILAATIRVTFAADLPSNAAEIINRFAEFTKSHGSSATLVYKESYQTHDGAQQRWRFVTVDPSQPGTPPMIITCKADSNWDQFVTELYGDYAYSFTEAKIVKELVLNQCWKKVLAWESLCSDARANQYAQFPRLRNLLLIKSSTRLDWQSVCGQLAHVSSSFSSSWLRDFFGLYLIGFPIGRRVHLASKG